MGQEISELNKPVGAQEDSGDYLQNSGNLSASKNPANNGDQHQQANDGFDLNSGKSGDYPGTADLFVDEQMNINFNDSYGTATGQFGEQQQHKQQSNEQSTGGGSMSPSQQRQLHQLLLRHQQQVPYQPQQQQSKQQSQGFLPQVRQQPHKPGSRRPSVMYAESLYAMLSAKNLPSLEAIGGKPIKRLTDEEITKIIEKEGCDEIDIYDTSVPVGLKKILSSLETSDTPQPLNRSIPKLPETRLSPNAVEFVPGRPYGSKLEGSVASMALSTTN